MSDTTLIPIELPNTLYRDLKVVSNRQNTSMAEVIRSLVKMHISPQASMLELRDSGQKPPTSLLELAKPLTYHGTRHHPDKSDDELLYRK